jgi:hypothetical protein
MNPRLTALQDCQSGSDIQGEETGGKQTAFQGDSHCVRLELLPNPNKLGQRRTVGTNVNLKLLDKLLHWAQYQPPEYIPMTGGKSSSSDSFCEQASQTFVVVLARIVVAHGG